MKEAYKKSLQMIKENNIKDIKEYTKLAKKEDLLNPVSLEYISRKSFDNLIKGVLKSWHTYWHTKQYKKCTK